MKQDTTRKCIVTGEILDKSQLLRFVAVDNVGIVSDFKRKLDGKGVYVTNSKTCLEKAVKANLFAKALKEKVKVDADLVSMVEKLLRNQALHAISLARKAGGVVWGLDKSLEAIKKNKADFVVEASDAGNDGKKKLASHAGSLEIYKLFSSEELDKELGMENTVYLVFTRSAMSDSVRKAFIRLNTFLNS